MNEKFEFDSDSVFAGEVKRKKPRVAKATLKGCTRLNVRVAAVIDAPVAGVVNESDRIKVDLSHNEHPGWIYVLEPVYGFAKAEFLKVT